MILILKRIQNQNHFMISYYNYIELNYFMVLMNLWSIIRCRMSTLLLPTIYNGQQNIYKKYSSIWTKSDAKLI